MLFSVTAIAATRSPTIAYSAIDSARIRAVAAGVPVSGYSDSTGRYTVWPTGSVIADSVRDSARVDARR